MEQFAILKKKVLKIQPVVFTELFFWIVFMASIGLKCLYFQITTNLTSRNFSTPQNIFMLISSIGTLFIISAIVFLIFNKRRKVGLLVFNILITLLLVSDTIYFRYYSNAVTVPVLYQIGLLGPLGGSIKSLLKVKDIIFVLDFPFIIVGLILLRKINKAEVISINFVKRLVGALIVAAIGLTTVQIAYSSTDTSTFPYDNNSVIKNLGVLYFHSYDVNKYVKQNFLENRSLTKAQKDEIDNFFKKKTKDGDKYKGIAKNKNLIVIQVEALQQFVINKTINGKEITPNLNKLIKDSVYFDNYYYQVAGGNTSDAELLSNASLYPIKEGAAFFRYPTNTYYTLPKALKEQGYNSYVFHANNPSFWNRTVMYNSFGFDTFISNKDFDIDEYVGWGGWALSDASFFRQSLEKIDKTKPFYGFLITLSSHHPFSYFNDYDKFDVGEYNKTYFGNYLKAINYTDSALGKFMDELKEQGLYDNTVIAIYGDHYAVPRIEADAMFKFLGKDFSEFEFQKLQKVPLIIHYPGLKNGAVVSTTGGEIDLFPTIANIMDLPAPYAVGKDLLNTNYGYAVLRSNNVITDKYIYLSNDDIIYDIKDGKQLNKADYQDEIKSFQNHLNISDLIIGKNALKK